MKKHLTSFIRYGLLAACLAMLPRNGLAADLFVANGNNTIQEFTPSAVGSVFASIGLNNPYGLAFDTAGNLFAANFADGTIEKFMLGGVGSVFASLGASSHPTGLAFDSAGNLYVAKFSGSIVRLTSDGTQSVFASTGLFQVESIAFDSTGNLYAASNRNGSAAGTIEKITPGGVVSNFASGLSGPYGLAVDSSDNLYLANSFVNTIVKFTPSGVSSIFATNGLFDPVGLAFDGAGNLYAANSGIGGGNGSIERFTPEGIPSFFSSTNSGSPKLITFQAPEPTTAFLLLSGATLCLRRRSLTTHQIQTQ